MKKKIKISQKTLDELLHDIHQLTEISVLLGRAVEKLEVRVRVLESHPVTGARRVRQDDLWWQNPVVSFQGKDAGEQAAL